MKMQRRNYTILFHRKKSGTVKVWESWIVGQSVFSKWGQQGGKMNNTSEFSQDPDAKQARKILLRKRKGYEETLGNVIEQVEVKTTQGLNFEKLPRSFAPAKPLKSFNPTQMAEWDRQKLLIVQRKRDGERHRLVSDSRARLRVYSSSNDDVTDLLEPLLEGLTLPPKTLVDVELVVTGPKGEDNFEMVSSIKRSLPDRAQRKIAEFQDKGFFVQLLAFDLLWENGVAVWKNPYEQRYRRLAKLLDRGYDDEQNPDPEPRMVLRMPPVSISWTRTATLKESIDLVRKHKWEGLVVWRRDHATVCHLNGSPARVNCWKLKPVKEIDIVATGYELGKGKNANVVGKFRIAFVNGSGMVPMGKCGGGLDDKTRADALKWKYPCVIQIEYDKRSEKGFRFPIFIRKRDDKKVSECVL